jgi:hypothetical protein
VLCRVGNLTSFILFLRLIARVVHQCMLRVRNLNNSSYHPPSNGQLEGNSEVSGGLLFCICHTPLFPPDRVWIGGWLLPRLTFYRHTQHLELSLGMFQVAFSLKPPGTIGGEGVGVGVVDGREVWGRTAGL